MITLPIIKKNASSNPNGIALESPEGVMTWKEYECEVASSIEAIKKHIPEGVRIVTLEGETKIDTFVAASSLATMGYTWISLQEESACAKKAQLEILNPPIRAIRNTKGDYSYIEVENASDMHLFDEYKGIKYQSITASAKYSEYVSCSFTSGTTGQPKLVLRRRSFESRRNSYLVRRFGFASSDRYYLALPISHASGHGWARTILDAGGTVVIGDRNPSSIASALLNKRITCTLLVPPVLSRVMNYIGENCGWTRQVTDLRFLLTGGRHVDSRTISNVEILIGEVLHSYYGTTETGINTIATPEDLKTNRRTAGRAIEGTTVAIVDSNGLPLVGGETGRVAVCSYMNADSYQGYNIPITHIGDDSYVITADVGRIQPDTGELFLLGRAGSTGDSVQMVDIVGLEEVLKQLRFVSDAAGVCRKEAVYIYVSCGPEADIGTNIVEENISAVEDVVLKFTTGRKAHISYVKRIQYNSTGKFDSSSTADESNLLKFQEVN